MSLRKKKRKKLSADFLISLSLFLKSEMENRRTATPSVVHLSRAEEEEAEEEEDIASRVTRAMTMAMAMMRSVDFVARGREEGEQVLCGVCERKNLLLGGWEVRN